MGRPKKSDLLDESAEQQQDPSFEEAKSPAIEHQKKIQRQIKADKKKKVPFVQFFTVKDGKVLSVKVKPNGAYSTFVAAKSSLEKKQKGSYALLVKQYKADGLWVSEEDYQDKCEQFKKQLQG